MSEAEEPALSLPKGPMHFVCTTKLLLGPEIRVRILRILTVFPYFRDAL
jgi:hypothetical protein